MQLVNMDVDRFGTNERCRLGPLSAGLNAICGPRGTGKTTLLNWLRQVVAECTATDGSLSREHQPSLAAGTARPFSVATGSVEIKNRAARCRITTDRNGRFQLDSSSNYEPQSIDFSAHRAPVLSSAQRQAFVGLAGTGAAHDSRNSLEQLATQLGLNHAVASDHRRSELRSHERELGLRLEQLQHLPTRETLLDRQKRLQSELATLSHQTSELHYVGHEVERRRIDERWAAIEADLRATVEQIEHVDRAIAAKTNELATLDDGGQGIDIDVSYREQLQRLDDRLNRWRQTLRDLKSHRETIENNATDARLDKQIGDQLASTKESDPRAAMRSLEAQILNTRKQLESLVERYGAVPGYDYRSATAAMQQPGLHETGRPEQNANSRVYYDASGRTYISREPYLPDSSLLPETLRTMQKDLQEVCQQLARYESKTATETLKQKAQQLKRCENELLQSVEKLIDERAVLLRTIANEHHISVEQLTLAFGNWCQCHDHPHLREWLLSSEKSAPASLQQTAAQRPALIEEIEQLKRERRQFSLRADDCRRQLRDADIHRSHEVRANAASQRTPSRTNRPAVEIERELERVQASLAEWDDGDRIRVELEDVRRQLRELFPMGAETSQFQYSVEQHISSLVPTQRMSLQPTSTRGSAELTTERRYDLVDGLVTDAPAERTRESLPQLAKHYQVPETVVRLALRLAIAEAMAKSGEPVCLLLDESLDELPLQLQQSAVDHLSRVAQQGQQIIILTGNERISDLVRSRQGAVHYMHVRSQTKADRDINRQLAAVANDHEADKWYQPHVQVDSRRSERSSTSEYYLRERSLIEDLPSIAPSSAARCRALGVDRIGDLLDIDPYWLAENLRLDGVSHATVIGWQAKARLLCSVRGLRPFDARVLVGVGIRTPRQLADMHPGELLERVEHFLATEAGRRIMQSGNSFELSRITTWIASAEGGGDRYQRSSFADERAFSRRSQSQHTDRRQRNNQDDRELRAAYHRESGTNRSRTSGQRSSSAREDRSVRERRSRRNRSGRRSTRAYPVIDRDGSRQGNWENRSSSADSRSERNSASSVSSKQTSSHDLRFYLEVSSPVVDAPSIGPRAAAKLEEHGIYTVGDLLSANADSLEDKLKNRRVNAATIRQWQEQARLVCRIPNLRGHDAQLLVACDLTSPEELSEMDPESVLASVLEIARGKQGQRILRGGNEPDLEEVTDWITWAASSRSLSAA